MWYTKFIMKYINFPQIRQRVQNIFNKKVDAVIVVDIGSKLTLLNIELRPQIKISALKTFHLVKHQRDKIILNALTNFIQENRILHKNVILEPYLESLLIKRIQLPAIPEAELLEAIKWQLKSEVSFDLSAAVIDFSVLKETARDDGSKVLDVISVVAQLEEIRPQVLLLKQLGLHCLAVAPLVFGYTKLLKDYFLKEKDEPIVILHMEEENCSISIHKENKLEFYRELPLSINKLRESLKAALFSDKGKIELSADEIDEVLFSIGVPQGDVVYKNKLNSLQILSMLRPTLERLAQEMKRSLTYYASQFQGGEVNKILVAGLAVEIPNLDKFLSQELSSSIRKISLVDKTIASSSINTKDLLQSYASFGLALDYGQGINLLPHEFRTEKFEKVQKVSLRWVAFIAFLLLVFSYIFAKLGVSSYQKRLDNALLHLNVLSEVKQIKTDIDGFNQFIIDIRNSEPPISAVLKKISSIASRELFIDDFSLNCDSKILKISGFIKNTNQNADAILNKFVRDMECSSYFINANISSVEKIKSQDTEIVEFNITFKLR